MITNWLTPLKNTKITSRQMMIEQISSLSNLKVVNIIDTHNTTSVIFIAELREQEIIIKADFGPTGCSVEKQIGWFESYGKSLSWVPQYLGSLNYENIHILVLKYIKKAKTLDQHVLTNSLSCEQVKQILDASTNNVYQLFHSYPHQNINIDSSYDWILKKFTIRKKQAEHFSYLKQLFSEKEISINDAPIPNYDYYISRIAKDNKLKDILMPTEFGVIHGDLHCGNILVNQQMHPFMVDPNGSPSLPLEYDYGKLAHSFLGNYGNIMTGKYILERKTDRDYVLEVPTSAAYREYFKYWKKLLPEKALYSSLLMCAMHFATMVPHHASAKKETTALYLTGLKIMHLLFENISIYA